MNFKLASAALIAATFAAGAYAESSTGTSSPMKSRADVQAELQAYRASGVNPWSSSYNPLRNFKSGLTREQVVADYIASRKEVAAFNGEDSGSSYLAQHAPAANGTALAGRPENAQ